MQTMDESMSISKGQVTRVGEFFRKLSPLALLDLEALEFPTSYKSGAILFGEKAASPAIFVIHSGEVKLSINSSDGKRLILSIAKVGEILGLSSALSGLPRNSTAEVICHSKIAIIGRSPFLRFLSRHPAAYQAVTEELDLQYRAACEQLRTVALSPSVHERLARLLLGWNDGGQKNEFGTECRFSFTHEEIGEFIGATRETVSRTLSFFKTRRLVVFDGTTLTIPSRMALESLAGI
jgi:CRP/FNR family cyclic AMP-dependent transcriptional regulator